MKKTLCLLLLPLLFLFSACGEGEQGGHSSLKERVFRAGEMEICLDESFAQAAMPGYDACYTSEHVDVFALREAFTLAEGLEAMTLSEYAKTMIDGNAQAASATVLEEDGLCRFEYTALQGGIRFVYVSYLYKSDTSFWVVQFATPEEKLEPLRSFITDWAKSVSFPAE